MTTQNGHIGRKIARSDAFCEPTELNAIAENAELRHRQRQDRKRVKALVEERRRRIEQVTTLKERIEALEEENEELRDALHDCWYVFTELSRYQDGVLIIDHADYAAETPNFDVLLDGSPDPH